MRPASCRFHCDLSLFNTVKSLWDVVRMRELLMRSAGRERKIAIEHL